MPKKCTKKCGDKAGILANCPCKDNFIVRMINKLIGLLQGNK